MTRGFMTPDDFLAGVLTHDISNANQTIRGYLEMLLDEQMGTLNHEQSRALESCLRQSRRIRSLIDSARHLQHLSTTEKDIQPQDLDLSIREAIETIQSEFSDRDIRVRFMPEERRVLAEEHLTLLFRHLLANAVQHSNADLVEVELQINRIETPPPSWRIRLIDNGPGIPDHMRQSIFTRLERRDIHGAGLGLSLVMALIDRWNGTITLEPGAKDEGAAFALTLPAA